jgi:hypothetical protein
MGKKPAKDKTKTPKQPKTRITWTPYTKPSGSIGWRKGKRKEQSP